ncbi:unnamed protein product [Mytilus coruscus]|uniref:C17orf113 probable zinc finger domain-containing protein n=1 Tax=Mytilus coruscus TaxID=42192 RepID=A0A6J8F4W4_MYTCO|nr:unnamed protein product [Mytilus coruscus]
MWKYISGAMPPQKRKNEDKGTYFREYEKTKRVRNYSTYWEKDRSWLKVSEEGMICLTCQQYGDPKTNIFSSGCKSYKLDSIVKHERSKNHEKSVLIEKAKIETKSESKAAKIVQTLNKENFDKLNKMFRTCHAMVKNNRPLSDFNWICQLDEMKGLHIGNTYRNSSSAKTFIRAIAETEFNKVSSIVQSGKFSCLIGDGSTDSSVKEQVMWYLRTSIA